MSSGYLIKFEPVEWSEGARVYRVLASGWEGAPRCPDVPTVGSLTIDMLARTATFVPSGPWSDAALVPNFENWPLPSDDEDPGLCGGVYFEGFLKRLIWRAVRTQAGERVLFYR